MASVHQAEEQLKTLEKEISRMSREKDEEIRRITEMSRSNLEELKTECERKITNDRLNTEMRYQDLLNNAVREITNEKEAKLSKLESEYYALKMKLEEETRRQEQETRKVRQTQEEFQKQYEAALELSGKIADEQIARASEKLREFDATEPYEWFPPNKRSLFYEHLNMAVQCRSSGLYQAAVGVADSLVMTIEIEQNRIEHLFDRWVVNYSALKELASAEKRMILEESRDISWVSGELKAEWELTDILPDDTVRLWIKSDYFRYVSAFESSDENIPTDLGDIDFDGTEESRRKIKALMSSRKVTRAIAAEDLYKKAAEISVRLSYESEYICAMRSRIICYDERCSLKSVIDDMFSGIGFVNTVNRFENDDPRDSLMLVYENINRDDQVVQIFIVPVFSALENKWYNNIGYCVGADDHEICQEISEMLKMNLQEANALYEENGQGLTPEQISGRLKQRFNSTVNGHAVSSANA